ncbi:glmZ(sRNA)-inactivating NTPase [Kingella potus]|uniref:GlmZ(SRNA)-inactivating NTPase n=1 Tax=Kingella potus TaxID=265175 RepID=A0A377R1T2_9NEIS|nr:RNase adapter RapZ [Kingella potus]UOP01409.1 RNase adapter RapZ [Kingella potus]STR00271.1 glmZ(sRNA)-inactivating NTPase [Kingella potus]
MKITLISGLSGSGKSVALKLLEDAGCYCVDNLPIEMLPALVAYHIKRGEVANLAVSVDIRSHLKTGEVEKQLARLKQQGHSADILFLEAAESVLLRRFSETRRSHPLSSSGSPLPENLRRERQILFPLRDLAYRIDTSQMNAQQLRSTVRQWFDAGNGGLTMVFESFGFKYGTPADADFMFDVRSLPNPYYLPDLRPFNGTQNEIRSYLDAQPQAAAMVQDIGGFLSRRLPEIQAESRSYLTIAVGCTGGRHRSVYISERLAERFRPHCRVLVRHLRLNAE